MELNKYFWLCESNQLYKKHNYINVQNKHDSCCQMEFQMKNYFWFQSLQQIEQTHKNWQSSYY